MKTPSRLSTVLHGLLHMAGQVEPMTSETLAQCLHTHPVVVRRSMASLRQAGLVHSLRGHGGGWSLARPLSAISLRDVYAALQETLSVKVDIGAPHAQCLVEQAVTRVLADAYLEAEALLVARLGEISLQALLLDIGNGAPFTAGGPPPAGLLAHPPTPS
ncbi:Rrf2 family transcriptional regulator [Janthinobacterium sp. 1_2014MBL_MicDiv]|uniref:Rrf2 family transcriptional regulator n=1 Tax=Janthinobacterium sp. 1_2014MBL_MicDiv TaxID=1644131 RepID=UPI0008F5168D|nr:Rrf2 family transcriptional regulator [Janthinobacterium sp. 1_2014MBL_MicDiv]